MEQVSKKSINEKTESVPISNGVKEEMNINDDERKCY